MTHLQNLRLHQFLKWGSFNFSQNILNLSKPSLCDAVKSQNPRFYKTKRVVEAESALLDYLHHTRCLPFVDAENMSKNSPVFVDQLLKRAVSAGAANVDIERSVTRFLCYNPINEFEPFFESLGLEPKEYASLLPRDFTYLSDDTLLLENYHLLCDYGIERNKIGKIYKEATEVFRYDYGILMSKLRAYEALGFHRRFLMKVIVSSPTLLIGDVDSSFIEVTEKLRIMGFDCRWIESHLEEDDLINWRQIVEVLASFSRLGFTEEQLVELLNKNPRLLFEGSGKKTFSIIGLLLKFGSTKKELFSTFSELPQSDIVQFVYNLRQAIKLFMYIEMEPEHFRRIVCSYPIMLGGCAIKKGNSLLCNLNVGKKRICSIIIENPQVMKNWVLGAKVQQEPTTGENIISRQEKIKFLSGLGFVEDSEEMKRALKIFRGKGGELQERFNSLVKTGLDRNDVVRMVKKAPQLLNQSKEAIATKIDFLLNGMKLPISTLKAFPGYVCYTTQKVKLRFTMYSWLKDQGTITFPFKLSTIMSISDKLFEQRFVAKHPEGPQTWQNLRNQLLSK